MSRRTIKSWLDQERNTPFYFNLEQLLQYILKKSRTQIYLIQDELLSVENDQKLSQLLEDSKKGKPLAYIIGETGFFESQFYTEKGVFIPRADTETLVETVLEHYQNNSTKEKFYFMDIGSGSGCIGLSFLRKIENAHLIAVDLNKKALELTQKNALRYSIEDRLTLVHQDIMNVDIKNLPTCSFVTANPPYISYNDPEIDPLVHKSEPHLALYSPQKGLEAIESWFHKAHGLLSKEDPKASQLRKYFFEIGYNQSDDVERMLSDSHLLKSFSFYKDLNGINRVVHCQFK